MDYMIEAVLIFIVGTLAAFAWGKKKAHDDAKAKDNEDYVNTRKRIDEAVENLGDDVGLNREWLRQRGEQ